MTNHPLFGFQSSLVVDRLVLINVTVPTTGTQFIGRQTDMSGRGNKRFLRLADAEADFIQTAPALLVRPDAVGFDRQVLLNLGNDHHYIANVLATMVHRQANMIAQRTKRTKGNSVIVSRWALAVLFDALTIDEEPAFYPHGKEDSGLVYMGVNNGIKVYLHPTMPATAPLLVAYTGADNNSDAGAFIANVNGVYHVMTPDNDPPEVVTKWTDYYGIVPVMN